MSFSSIRTKSRVPETIYSLECTTSRRLPVLKFRPNTIFTANGYVFHSELLQIIMKATVL